MHIIISELKVLESKRSAYSDSFCVLAETDTKNSEQLTFCDNNDNCDHQSSQHDPGANTNDLQPFTVDEQDVTPLSSPTNKTAPAITSNVNTPSPQDKSNISFEEHQQFINRIEAQIFELKNHMKCELCKIDSLWEFEDTKIKNLNDQQNILETLRENIKFLQMELQAKNGKKGTDQPNKVSNQHQHNQN